MITHDPYMTNDLNSSSDGFLWRKELNIADNLALLRLRMEQKVPDCLFLHPGQREDSFPEEFQPARYKELVFPLEFPFRRRPSLRVPGSVRRQSRRWPTSHKVYFKLSTNRSNDMSFSYLDIVVWPVARNFANVCVLRDGNK